ncbi:hypothetical protein SCHPADRAFT_946010 [Schizopora paradoxa]|uniref:DUF6533 domain-containing protein n=1 Tax=Schizopora paradoxa TaxID=27342 RepID=A0A0H2RAM8_9AGAM|nr:hypothetical protein SCHPADRAFT_946010 [Schizopora paradoxa]
MADPIDVFENLEWFLTQEAFVKYTAVAMITLLAYDTIISISDEINNIWEQHWSLGKALYLLARYSSFIDIVPVLWYTFTASSTHKASP